MDEKSGNKRVPTDTDSGESSDQPQAAISSDTGTPLMVGSFDIDTAIQMHLVDCQQCRDFTMDARPMPNVRLSGGRKDGHCDAYWQLQWMRAEYEGKVNNIVA